MKSAVNAMEGRASDMADENSMGLCVTQPAHRA
jgi:hypothetical protein